MNFEDDENEQITGLAAGYNIFGASTMNINLMAGVNKEI